MPDAPRNSEFVTTECSSPQYTPLSRGPSFIGWQVNSCMNHSELLSSSTDHSELFSQQSIMQLTPAEPRTSYGRVRDPWAISSAPSCSSSASSAFPCLRFLPHPFCSCARARLSALSMSEVRHKRRLVHACLLTGKADTCRLMHDFACA